MITILLVLSTVLVTILAFNTPKILDDFMMIPTRVSKYKEYFRFISSGFIHADYQHLIFNMFALFSFGRNTEMVFNDICSFAPNLMYLMFYLSAIVVSMIPSYFKNKNNVRYRSLGASGGVSAIVYTNVLFNPLGTVYVFILPMPTIVFGVLYIAYSIYMGKKNIDNVGHEVHLWGSIYGFFFPLFFQPLLIISFFAQIASVFVR
jgi:membrane associated rhomboid family serine protease